MEWKDKHRQLKPLLGRKEMRLQWVSKEETRKVWNYKHEVLFNDERIYVRRQAIKIPLQPSKVEIKIHDCEKLCHGFEWKQNNDKKNVLQFLTFASAFVGKHFLKGNGKS